MADVAKALKLHPSTVSLALRCHPRIPESRRKRVIEAAHRLGYRPNPMVAALMRTRRSGRVERGLSNLAVLYPDRAIFELPTTQCIQRAIVARGEEHGYTMDTFFASEWLENPKRLMKAMAARGCRALLLSDALSTEFLEKLPLEEFCVVTFCFKWRRYVAVETHFQHGILLCLEKATCLGLRRVGLLLPPLVEEKTGGSYLAAYLRWQSLRSVTVIPPLISDSIQKTRAWARKYRPDVVITNLSRQPHIHPAQEILLDCVPGSHIPGVNPRRDILGAAAVDMLLQQLQHGAFGEAETSRILLVEGEWCEPETGAL